MGDGHWYTKEGRRLLSSLFLVVWVQTVRKVGKTHQVLSFQ